MMKLIYVLLALLLSVKLFSQTNIIANKSHSGDLTNLNFDEDNFGMIPERINKIIYLGDNCIVEVGEWNKRDTICNHPDFEKYGYDLDEIKNLYPESTKFEGFEKLKKEKDAKAPAPMENSVFGLVIILLLSTAIYSVLPGLKKN